MKDLTRDSFLSGKNAEYIELLYAKYLQNKDSVGKDWQDFFAQYHEQHPQEMINAIYAREDFSKITHLRPSDNNMVAGDLNLKLQMLAQAYRNKGHRLTRLDPLDLETTPYPAQLGLDPKQFGISEEDLSSEILFESKTYIVRDLIKKLQDAYCMAAGFELQHINDSAEYEALTSYIEGYQEIGEKQQKQALQDLIEVESFEQFLQTKFPTAKRFSVEGADNSILAVLTMIQEASLDVVNEVVIGMAHRGRLNALTKIMQKPYVEMLAEFKGQLPFKEEYDLVGDVKYHEGYSSDKEINGKKIHLSMMFNPSHLEAVNPVLAGKVRARQDLHRDFTRKTVMGILLHGDASFSGQGIVAESLMLAGLKGYDVGGILHIIVNNQVGFTSTARDGRAGRYPSEVGKIAGAPVFHVNGNDALAVIKVCRIATWYRNRFGKDVVINLVCYRLHGHNEMDEPRFTQPVMYKKIDSLETPAKIFANHLSAKNIIAADFYEQYRSQFKDQLETALDHSAKFAPPALNWFKGQWQGLSIYQSEKSKDYPTGVDMDLLKKLGKKISVWPADVAVNPKIARQLEARAAMMESGTGVNWATAEALAFASLLIEGYNVRLSGQDSGRGTFSQRHSILIDQNNDQEFVPLNHLDEKQGNYEVIDSCLSEYAVMGFEYGYSLVSPKNLVLWEAQYGDFANGAQIIIDQYISSAELKWRRSSGVVLLLPHAYEGEGPEHSSARLERFLQLCAQDNIQVANCSTPASYFHILRRQLLRDYRKPLVIMTPKSLLRHKLAVSDLKEFAEGTSFAPLLGDDKIKQAKRVVFCTGKVYYELLEYRDANKISDVAIVRLEQLYPFANQEIIEQLSVYKAQEIVWCQEEPKNMGAWSFVQPLFNDLLDGKQIRYIGRKAYSSTADGYSYTHRRYQEELIKQAIILQE